MAETKTYTTIMPKRFRSYFAETRLNGDLAYEFADTVTYDEESHRTSESNPHWRAQIKAHVQAGTNLFAYRDRVDVKRYLIEEEANYVWKTTPNLTWTYLRSNEGDYVYGLPDFKISHIPVEAEANNRALTNYISKANYARRVIQSGEMIGEFAELVRQVKSPGKSLRKGLGAYVESVKKRTQRKSVTRLPRHRRSKEQAKIIGDTWLEYRFGWRPLISEIDATIDYINEEDPTARLDTRNILGVGKAEYSGWPLGDSSYKTIVSRTPGFDGRWREAIKTTVLYRGQVGMGSSAAGYTATKLGLHPTDWIPTAWELVPYSFLIDYFVNLGDIISAFSFPTSALRWTVKTVINEHTTTLVDIKPRWGWTDGGNAAADWTISRRLQSPVGAKRTFRQVERTRYNGTFFPDVAFSLPGSGTRWANIAALLSDAKGVQKLLS